MMLPAMRFDVHCVELSWFWFNVWDSILMSDGLVCRDGISRRRLEYPTPTFTEPCPSQYTMCSVFVCIPASPSTVRADYCSSVPSLQLFHITGYHAVDEAGLFSKSFLGFSAV